MKPLQTITILLVLLVTSACDMSLPTAPDEASADPTGPLAASLDITLLSPAQDAVLRQNDPSTGCPANSSRGYGTRLDLDWTAASHPSGVEYEVRVQKIGARLALIDTVTSATDLTRISCGAYIIDTNLRDWQWQVRAHTGDGQTGAWAIGHFHYEPCRLDDGRRCGG